MRYVTLLVKPTEDEAFHPVGERIATDADVTPEAVHRIDDLGDGTVTMLTEVTGDVDRYREILDDSPEVLEFTVADGEDDRGWGYSRTETNDLVEYMLQSHRENDFVRDLPIELTDDGAQRVTLIGSAEAFARAEPSQPEGYEIEIERTGKYRPEGGRLIDGLTTRQREVLQAAVHEGYYETPRQATHEEIADHVDCSPATVGEHLQKVERAVFGALVG